jgi:hypothetical protein
MSPIPPPLAAMMVATRHSTSTRVAGAASTSERSVPRSIKVLSSAKPPGSRTRAMSVARKRTVLGVVSQRSDGRITSAQIKIRSALPRLR